VLYLVVMKIGNNWTDFILIGGNELELTAYISSSTGITVNTNARFFRDVSAWYHIVLVYDSANGTASNRVKTYVNGVLQTINTAIISKPKLCLL
jgi:hypothetical protein